MSNQTLAQRLADRIRREGPITFHDWMESALYDEHGGYYQRKDLNRWGRAGDYRTSPEMSVLFAAVFARFFAELYEAAGSPEQFTIVEVGGGAGDFAASVLETLKRQFPRLYKSSSYVLDEVSQDAREQAAKRVTEFSSQTKFSRLHDLDPIDAGIIFSNELLDAFPVHRVTMIDGQLLEFYIDVDEATNFKWVTDRPSTPDLQAYLERFQIRLREGQIIEINTGLENWFCEIAEKLKSGYLVTVDYGAEAPDLYGAARPEGTLRAFKGHQFVADILDAPGTQDITTSIDWTAVQELGKDWGFETRQFHRQDQFLLNWGLLEELERRVTQANSEAEKVSLRTGAREMILPGGMAQSFQVLVQEKGRI